MMSVIRGTPQGGMKKMHDVACNGVPRTIGRTIRGTLSNGVKIIDVSGAMLELGAKITHMVHIQSVGERMGAA